MEHLGVGWLNFAPNNILVTSPNTILTIYQHFVDKNDNVNWWFGLVVEPIILGILPSQNQFHRRFLEYPEATNMNHQHQTNHPNTGDFCWRLYQSLLYNRGLRKQPISISWVYS